MFLTCVGKKRQCCSRGNYTSHVIISPTYSVHTCDWWHDSDMTYCYPPTEDKCGHGSSMPNCIKNYVFHEFKKWCKFSNHVKVKSHRKKLHTRPACILRTHNLFIKPVSLNYIQLNGYFLFYLHSIWELQISTLWSWAKEALEHVTAGQLCYKAHMAGVDNACEKYTCWTKSET
jgi:hypothetical protein